LGIIDLYKGVSMDMIRRKDVMYWTICINKDSCFLCLAGFLNTGTEEEGGGGGGVGGGR
jgi:hypothetical protein